MFFIRRGARLKLEELALARLSLRLSGEDVIGRSLAAALPPSLGRIVCSLCRRRLVEAAVIDSGTANLSSFPSPPRPRTHAGLASMSRAPEKKKRNACLNKIISVITTTIAMLDNT